MFGQASACFPVTWVRNPAGILQINLCGWTFYFTRICFDGLFLIWAILRGRKRHINIWHINNFSVTPVTDPPGREPDSSRQGTRTKTFMFLGFRTQHINFWPLANGRETPPPVGRPPPPLGSHRKKLFMFMCLFLYLNSWLFLVWVVLSKKPLFTKHCQKVGRSR